MNIAAEINQVTGGIDLGKILLGIAIALTVYVMQTFISRYFKYLDKKEEMADQRNKAVTDRLDLLKDTVKELGIQYLQLLEKVNVTGLVLEKTVEKVGKLEFEVAMLKKLSKEL